jgi:hypothetical protein
MYLAADNAGNLGKSLGLNNVCNKPTSMSFTSVRGFDGFKDMTPNV